MLRTTWDETWSILQKAVERGKSRKSIDPLPRIGIDEKAFRKGQNYITLIYNLDQSSVEVISDGNDTETANAECSQLSEEQPGSVQAIAMDMSAGYVKSAKANIPLAEEKIVHDRFHITEMANEAVAKLRKTEHRELKEDGDNRLTGTKFLWLTGTGNLSESQRKRFDAVYTQQLKTGRAWGYKEVLRDLWQHRTADEAIESFKDWYNRVIHTNMEPLKAVARSINERLANAVSYCTHGITNAVAEGINSKITAIKRRVGGYRNRDNFKTAIFFYCGGLKPLPTIIPHGPKKW